MEELKRCDVDPGPLLARCHLSAAALDRLLTEPVGRVHDLALEVRRVYGVVVDDAERSDTGSREVERSRAPETARTASVM